MQAVGGGERFSSQFPQDHINDARKRLSFMNLPLGFPDTRRIPDCHYSSQGRERGIIKTAWIRLRSAGCCT